MTSRVEDPYNIDLEAGRGDVPKKNCCARCCGYIWKDWTQIVGRVGMVAGISMSSLAEDPMFVAGGVAITVVAYLFPDCAVSAYKPEKELSERVADLNDENERLQAETQKLETHIIGLETITVHLGESWKSANQTVQDLGAQLTEKVKRIEKATKNLKQTEKKLKALETLYQHLKTQTKKFAEELLKFNQKNGVLKEGTKELEQTIEDLDGVEDDISEELKEFGSSNIFFEKQNDQMEKMLSCMTTNLTTLQNGFKEVREALVQLGKHTGKLDEVDDKFLEGANKIEGLVGQFQEIQERFKHLFEEK